MHASGEVDCKCVRHFLHQRSQGLTHTLQFHKALLVHQNWRHYFPASRHIILYQPASGIARHMSKWNWMYRSTSYPLDHFKNAIGSTTPQLIPGGDAIRHCKLYFDAKSLINCERNDSKTWNGEVFKSR